MSVGKKTETKIFSVANQFYPSPQVFENEHLIFISHSWGEMDISEIIDKLALLEPFSSRLQTFCKWMNRRLYKRNTEGFENSVLFEFACLWKSDSSLCWIATPGIHLACARPNEDPVSLHSATLLVDPVSKTALPWQAFGSTASLEVHSGLWTMEQQDVFILSSGTVSLPHLHALDTLAQLPGHEPVSPFWLARISASSDT